MVSDSVKFLVDAMVRQDEELRMLESDEDENSVSSLRSLTQLYSVDFSKSRIVGKKCVFNKRTIKACVSCF